MKKDNISILIFAESKSREDVYQNRLPIQNREVKKLLDNLSTAFNVDSENV